MALYLHIRAWKLLTCSCLRLFLKPSIWPCGCDLAGPHPSVRQPVWLWGRLLPAAADVFTDLCSCCHCQFENVLIAPQRNLQPHGCPLIPHPSHPLPTPSPRQPLLFLCLDSLFRTLRINGIMFVVLCVCRHPLSMTFSRFPHVGADISASHLFVAWPNGIPPCGPTAF